MATAEKTTVEVPVVTTTPAVRLILTPQEAATLRQVLSHIGGTPGAAPRGLMDNIGEALTKAGVAASKHALDRTNDSIYFA